MQRIAVHSDNRANNVLMDFAGGSGALNDAARACGLRGTCIKHRLSPCAKAEGVPTCDGADAFGPPITFRAPSGAFTTRAVAPFPGGASSEAAPRQREPVGVAHIASDGRLVHEPLDFAARNRCPIEDMQMLLERVLTRQVRGVAEGDLGALVDALACGPQDARRVGISLNRRTYFDDWNRLFAPGVARVVEYPRDVAIHGKLGQAYGFTLDNARIEHRPTGRAFYLAACIYTNANGILNDDLYEYDDAEGFFDSLAELVARALWSESAECIVTLGKSGALRVEVVRDVV